MFVMHLNEHLSCAYVGLNPPWHALTVDAQGRTFTGEAGEMPCAWRGASQSFRLGRRETMFFLDAVARCASGAPEALCVRTSDGALMTYGELWDASGAIAAHLLVGAEGPVVIFGHKDPFMVAGMIACMRAGRPYVPVDRHSVPAGRVASIVRQLGDPVVLDVEDAFPAEVPAPHRIGRADIELAVHAGGEPETRLAIAGENLCYILFTSGSTGEPKGVAVTAACLDNFCRWSLTLVGDLRPGRVYLDQAPFSFDLSVFELAGALAQGGTLFSLTHSTLESAAKKERALATSGVNVWVSTPSFAELCLADPAFDACLLGSLETFLFCGETLPLTCARELAHRFPATRILNTYGPTESTVAVTAVEVTDKMLAREEPLPVGSPRPGTRLRIVDAAGEEVPRGTWGEVVIEGDTVAAGYFGRPDLTAAAFGEAELDGRRVRTYRTGDEGMLDTTGMLHYRGRLDAQVKMNGYRIELGEIEAQLRRVAHVRAAAVVAVERDGRVHHLAAFVVSDAPHPAGDFRAGLALKEELKQVLPHYMVPRTVRFIDALPQTPNGKVDRRLLVNVAAGKLVLAPADNRA